MRVTILSSAVSVAFTKPKQSEFRMTSTIVILPSAREFPGRYLRHAKPVHCIYFGAYGWTRVYARGSIEDALEQATEWAREHAPGYLTEPDYGLKEREYYCPECGYSPWDGRGCDHQCHSAEDDLTYTESGWIVSHEWHCDEVGLFTPFQERYRASARARKAFNTHRRLGAMRRRKF